jgi:hypothetical protein
LLRYTRFVVVAPNHQSGGAALLAIQN